MSKPNLPRSIPVSLLTIFKEKLPLSYVISYESKIESLILSHQNFHKSLGMLLQVVAEKLLYSLTKAYFISSRLTL